MVEQVFVVNFPNQSSSVSITGPLPAGNNNIGIVSLNPATAGGWNAYRLLSANTTNANSIKGSAGQLGGWYLTNTNAAPRYLKIYNSATAPTPGVGTPVLTLMIPGNANGTGANVEIANGIAFSAGIGITVTGGVADDDTTSINTNEVIVNLLYK